MLSLLRRKLQKLYGNDAVGTSTCILIIFIGNFCGYMADHSGTCSFILVAVIAMLDDLSFKSGSEVASHPHAAADGDSESLM